MSVPPEGDPERRSRPTTSRPSKATVQGLGGPTPRSLDLADSSPGSLPAETEPKKSVATIDLSGLLATSPDAVRRRLLGPWAEGLRQYLALRLGDLDQADIQFGELRNAVEAAKVEDIVQPPGARARIYRMARGLLPGASRGAGETAPRPATALAFRPPKQERPGYADALARLREGLSPADAELLELRWARELSTDEIAFVLGMEAADVQTALGRGVARARDLLAEHGRQGAQGDTIASAVVDAFALQPNPSRGPSAPTGLEPGTLIGGRYRIVKQVGAGAFGEVYRAEDQDVPGHVVAIKLLREPALSQMVREHHLRELKLIAAVFHPSVVHFKDHGWFEDRLWFVMPWYEGETLEKRMRRVGGIDRREARRIFEPVARALATLHGSKIRHQDIKPDNIFLARIHGAGDDDGVLPVLLDLGVAATEHEALIGGTPVYFAPEVAAHYAMKADAPDVGPPADVFALALTLRNALEPETEEDVPAGAVEAFIEKRSRTAPPVVTRPDLVYLRQHFDRWLALDAERRPTAEQLAQELAALTAPEEQAERRRRLLSVVAPIVVIALSVVGALGYVYLRERDLAARELSAARDDAERAHDEAARVSADLLVEEARRAAAESNHEEARRALDAERLTREELESRYATASEQIRLLGEQLATILAARDRVTGELTRSRELLSSAQRDLDEAGRSLASVRGDLAVEVARREAVEGSLADVRDDLEAEREARAEAEDELRADLTAARAEAEDAARREREATESLGAAEAAAEAAQTAQRQADAARDRAAADLEEAERTIASLRRRIEELERGPGPAPEAGATSPAP